MPQTSELKGLHAVGYCRVSTDNMGQTNETQKRLIGEWAQARGVVIDDYFMDEISGAQFPRPALTMALATLEITNASFIVAYDPDRITRAGECDMSTITKMLHGKGIRYVTNGDLDPNSLGGKITNNIKTLLAQEELEKIHKRTSAGMDTRTKAGYHMGRPAKLVITADPSKGPKGRIATADGSTIHGKARQVTTQILTPSEVLRFASAGYTPYKISKILGVHQSTFTSALKKANLTEEYYNVLKGASE